MNDFELSEHAILFEEKANQFEAAGHAELATKFRQAHRAALDAMFPSYEGERERATVILQGIVAWLGEYDRRLDDGRHDAA